jgi:hypothetical protein
LIEFIGLGGENLISFYPAILGSIMYCISDTETDIFKAAQSGNQKFIELVRLTECSFPFAPIVRTSTLELLAPQVELLLCLTSPYCCHIASPHLPVSSGHDKNRCPHVDQNAAREECGGNESTE